MGSGHAAVVPIGVGSQAWAERLRSRAKDLVRVCDTGYIDLAKILHNIYHVPIDGDPERGPWYYRWGYSSFSDYAEQDLGIKSYKASRLRAVGTMLEVQLASIPYELKQRLVALGWSRLSTLVRVFSYRWDRDTVERWAAEAEQLSIARLDHTVQKAIAKFSMSVEARREYERSEKLMDGEVAGFGFDEDEDEDEEEEASESRDEARRDEVEDAVTEERRSGSSLSDESGLVEGEVERDDFMVDEPILPEPQRVRRFTFMLVDEQIDNVVLALQRAEQLARAYGAQARSSLSQSNMFSLMAVDFLATNEIRDAGSVDPQSVAQHLSRIEAVLGVKLIASRGRDILYGSGAFVSMVESVIEDEKEADKETDKEAAT